jgi:processive 1,2-diacylglycerol beta-glucosyltransferase
MHELMRMSSCILTKAGGITLTEAIAQALPVIVYRPLPGQEAGNAAALASRNIIDVVHSEDELISRLQLLEEQEYREQRRRLMRSYCRRSSAEYIVAEALKVIDIRQPAAVQAKPQIVEGQATTIHGYLKT